MRIAVNTRLLLHNKLDGIGWFTAETLRRIVVDHPEHDFFFLFDRQPSPEFIYADNVHPVVLHPQARHPILWHLFFQWSIPRALKHLNADLFLSPDGYTTLRTSIPTLTVIHDINFEHAANNLKPSHQRYMTRYSSQFAHHSTRIATVSEYSKQDISETYHINPDKIDVVYDGAHDNYAPLSPEDKQRVRQQYSCDRPYYIFISTIIKRKNLANLLLAFDKYKKNDTQNMQLIVVGSRVWWQDELKEAYDNMLHKEDVHFIGRATPAELAQLLGAAEALVYPSFFEGFGIPILEAFHAETPVITSNTTSMPEVAGDAALLIDPHSVDDIANALQQISSDSQLCQNLIDKGRTQRARFSWDRTAELLWQSIEQTTQSACEKIG